VESSSLETVGLIAGVFGIKGWVKVVSYTEPADNIFSYSPWTVRLRREQRELEVERFQAHKTGWIAKIKGIDDRNAAESLARAKIVVDPGLFEALPEGDFYWRDLIGLNAVIVEEQKEITIGTVHSLMETGANDVLVIHPDDNSADDRERLVPYVPEIYVEEIDLEQGKIVLNWNLED
jgi:16S rRNA processing protein RimM